MRISALFGLTVAAISLSGCYGDPFQNPNQWALTGASRQNVAAQASNPADLIHGHGAPNSDGVAASAAIDKALGGSAGSAAGLQTAPPSLNFGS